MRGFSAFFVLWCAIGFASAEEVSWGPVGEGELTSTLQVPGKLIPKEGALIIESARVPGRITDIVKREGEAVSNGDVLFNINGPECVSLAEEKRVAQSRNLSDLVAAAADRERQLGLKVGANDCGVLAGHGGTLIKRQVEVGASFNIGDPLATLLDTTHLAIELDVPERDVSLIRLGQVVRVQLASVPERTFESTIQHILPTIDPMTRTSKVRLAPMELPLGATLDALVFARIETNSRRRILRVPTAAVVFNRDKQYVIKKGRADPTAVPVEVVSESDEFCSIRPETGATLAAGDQVAVKGAIFLLNKLSL